MRGYSGSTLLVFAWALMAACGSSNNLQERTQFTHLDSLTDTYLVLQDSALHAWNRVVKAETEKTEALRYLVEQLDTLAQSSIVAVFRQRIDQLERIRFTPKSVSNRDVISEYDQACQSILVDLASAAATYAHQPLVANRLTWINQLQASIFSHRQYYDSVAEAFNRFVEQHAHELREIERNAHLERKPLFNTEVPVR
jgi:prophage DNA circulation protein